MTRVGMLVGSIKIYKKPILTVPSYPGRDPRISRVLDRASRRQFPILLFGILTVGFLAVNGALNASTGANSVEKQPSFLNWVLQNEGQPVQTPTPKPVRQAKPARHVVAKPTPSCFSATTNPSCSSATTKEFGKYTACNHAN